MGSMCREGLNPITRAYLPIKNTHGTFSKSGMGPFFHCDTVLVTINSCSVVMPAARQILVSGRRALSIVSSILEFR